MSMPSVDRIKGIKTFASLVKYLRDDLGWPLDAENIDDLAFDYDPEEVGLDESYADKIKSIKQLRPLVSGQPWGIFYVEFRTERLPVVILRRILRALVIKRRASANRAERAVWQLNDLMFISALGEEDHRGMSFAHFHENGDGLPELRTFSWDERETHFYYLQNLNLERLRWPRLERDVEVWRNQWSGAFTAGHREAIGTAKQLSSEMARIACRARDVVKEILPHESKKTGRLKKLFAAFQKVLIHDLTVDSFADMIAQTVVYGLFTARVTGDKVLGLHQLEELVPVTNPFLKDLFAQLTEVGGKGKHQFDVDELGIAELVDLLNHAHMDNVMRDAGRQTGGGKEDPIIYFYEEFLKAYDKKQKIKRGEFYTPLPVVSYIVRSVHEILIKDFGLELGLADTTTWGEMQKKHPDLKIPDGVSPDEPFVQILDPATGTGTFLAFTIDLIHETLVTNWRKQGKREVETKQLWNAYVPRHLLPRLHGFQLVVAPYAVAHMRLSMKFKETGYYLTAPDRLEVYLTNTLEPSSDSTSQLEIISPALANEAKVVSKVKQHTKFTVVIGNPPYSKFSANDSKAADGSLTFIGRLIEDYKTVDGNPLGERNPKWLQDDYAKFIRFAQWAIANAPVGVLGFVTNHGYIDNPTFRGMRRSLLKSFNTLSIFDLHGNTRKAETSPDGLPDENVFDIQQGVAILLASRKPNTGGTDQINLSSLWGTRTAKYQVLLQSEIMSTQWSSLKPIAPTYLFVSQNIDLRNEYHQWPLITEIYSTYASTVTTARNHFSMAYDPETLMSRVNDLRDASLSDKVIRERYSLNDVSYWKVASARSQLRQVKNIRGYVKPYCYRPFDFRYIFYHPSVCERLRPEVMRHMHQSNVALLTHRPQSPGEFTYAYCTNMIGDQCVAANKSGGGGNSFQFPLYTYPDRESLGFDSHASVNFLPAFVKAMAEQLGVPVSGRTHIPNGLLPEDIFHYIYAIVYSPIYRSRYAEFLKLDFPRVPVAASLDCLRSLARLGGDLTALHLLDDSYVHASWNITKGESLLARHVLHFVDTGGREVESGYPPKQLSDNRVHINLKSFFTGMTEDIWAFQIGGYQVCHKWLLDRQGRTLSEEDIRHYHRIVVAIKETIRLMKEIDEVINEHGGWPDAFAPK